MPPNPALSLRQFFFKPRWVVLLFIPEKNVIASKPKVKRPRQATDDWRKEGE
jgi:hypothetical protein